MNLFAHDISKNSEKKYSENQLVTNLYNELLFIMIVKQFDMHFFVRKDQKYNTK